ncbi:hypothetical protein ACA910_018052 [Epithemia clementina (nom. ined.)]
MGVDNVPGSNHDVDGSELPKDRNRKATKNNDARIPEDLWDNKIQDGLLFPVTNEVAFKRSLLLLCRFSHRVWIRKVESEFWSWFLNESERLKSQGQLVEINCSQKAGLCALMHARKSSWWDWDSGSLPFFWRFLKEWRADMRDGLPPMWIGTPPRYTKRQQNPSDESTRKQE